MVSERTVNGFARRYSEFTKESVRSALRDIEKKGRVDAVTVDFHLRQKKFGGLGKGVIKKKLKRVM